MTEFIKNQTIPSKNSHSVKKSIINKGKWTAEENKNFDILVEQMYCGEISKRELYQRFPSRSHKQILSKLNKRRYVYEKEYGLLNSKEKSENFQSSLLSLKKLIAEEKRSYIELQDEQKRRVIKIERNLLFDLMKTNLNRHDTVLRVDEKIMKTLALAKNSILTMRKFVEDEKRNMLLDEYGSKTLVNIETKSEENFEDQNSTEHGTPFMLENHFKFQEDFSTITKWNELKFVESNKVSPIEGKLSSSIKLNGYLRSNISVSKLLFEENFLNTSNFLDNY